MSGIERVWGTTTSRAGCNGQFPRMEIRPHEGVYAHSALFDAGLRPEDTVSSARPNMAKFAVVATPDPLEEPDA